MRNNQPVSQREYAFPDQQRLISTTDLKGQITYCNDIFAEVSGFARDELIRAPHNLVRHPDASQLEALKALPMMLKIGLSKPIGLKVYADIAERAHKRRHSHHKTKISRALVKKCCKPGMRTHTASSLTNATLLGKLVVLLLL